MKVTCRSFPHQVSDKEVLKALGTQTNVSKRGGEGVGARGGGYGGVSRAWPLQGIVPHETPEDSNERPGSPPSLSCTPSSLSFTSLLFFLKLNFNICHSWSPMHVLFSHAALRTQSGVIIYNRMVTNTARPT